MSASFFCLKKRRLGLPATKDIWSYIVLKFSEGLYMLMKFILVDSSIVQITTISKRSVFSSPLSIAETGLLDVILYYLESVIFSILITWVFNNVWILFDLDFFLDISNNL